MITKLKKRLANGRTLPDFEMRKSGARALEPYIVQILCDLGRERSLNDPHQTLRLLRQSFAPASVGVVEVKDTGKRETPAARRFVRVIEAMSDLPPMPEAQARRCAMIADACRGNFGAFPQRDADVAWQFSRVSTSMLAGRVLAAVVRFMRPERCLEIGTAYGFSASIIASALERVSPQGRLLTIEKSEVQHRLASNLLADLFGERIVCRKGDTRELLPSAAAELAPLGFVFHDGGHSEEHYVRDFNVMVEALAPGAAVIFDDIRWRDRDRPDADPRCYEGWRRVVAHRGSSAPSRPARRSACCWCRRRRRSRRISSSRWPASRPFRSGSARPACTSRCGSTTPT